MAGRSEQDFNRSGLTVSRDRVWYTGQRAHRIPTGLVGVVGSDCSSLDLSFNELKSILAVRDFPHLQELILDNNELKDLKTLPKLPELTTLSINNNKISDIDGALERIRACCPRVCYVSLLGNPGCPDQLTQRPDGAIEEADYERYRLYAIHALPETLRFLDSRPVSAHELSQARSRGRLLKTVRPVAGRDEPPLAPKPDAFDEVDFHVNYTPLPKAVRTPQEHKGELLCSFAPTRCEKTLVRELTGSVDIVTPVKIRKEIALYQTTTYEPQIPDYVERPIIGDYYGKTQQIISERKFNSIVKITFCICIICFNIYLLHIFFQNT